MEKIAMIREFKDNDLDRIMALWLETNLTAHNFVEYNYWRNNYDSVKQMIPESTVLVYEKDNYIIGFIGLSEDYIAGIFVEQKYQSSGVGKALLDYAKERNEELILQVYKKNNRAINFYLREGFIIDHEEIDIDTNEVELIMKWIKNK